jgi:ABC-type phosphate transport system auxiliary subunit
MNMFKDPKAWRRAVNERLYLVKQDLAYFRGPDAERSSLEHRVRLLEEELKRLDEEEEERGTQWLDPNTGRSADM